MDNFTQYSYPTGIVDWKTKKVYSPTLASLIHLGATILITEEDKQLLEEECKSHFTEDCNGKVKVLGLCPAAALKNIKEIIDPDVDHADSKLVYTINPLFSLTSPDDRN